MSKKREGKTLLHGKRKLKVEKVIRLTKEEVLLIASTPPRECWICDYLVEQVEKDEEGYYIPESKLFDEGIREHLNQIIGKEIVSL